CRAISGAIKGNDEAFKTAPRIAHAEQLERIEHGVDGFLWSWFKNDTEQAGGSGEIPLPDRVTRIAFERRMQHAQDLGPAGKPLRHFQPRAVVLCEPHRKRS